MERGPIANDETSASIGEIGPDPTGFRRLPTKRLVILLLRYRELEALAVATPRRPGGVRLPVTYTAARIDELRAELCRRRRHELARVMVS